MTWYGYVEGWFAKKSSEREEKQHVCHIKHCMTKECTVVVYHDGLQVLRPLRLDGKTQTLSLCMNGMYTTIMILYANMI